MVIPWGLEFATAEGDHRTHHSHSFTKRSRMGEIIDEILASLIGFHRKMCPKSPPALKF